jgi:FMN phosphatase YigB (HAD superfamily)
MGFEPMKIRAVIVDVYRTLLQVGPAPEDATVRWRWLWENTLGRKPRVDVATFETACRAVVAREHAAARSRGVRHPEVYWPEVLMEVLPELDVLPPDVRRGFEIAHARMSRATSLVPGATPLLRLAWNSGVLLGIASNAQPYTLRELSEALEGVGLGMDMFRPDLTFWSFEHGFSKPDPHVFQVLTARLAARGIDPRETLMVGDRVDNDIEPARAFGWQTYQVLVEGAVRGEGPAGAWQELASWLDGRLG